MGLDWKWLFLHTASYLLIYNKECIMALGEAFSVCSHVSAHNLQRAKVHNVSQMKAPSRMESGSSRLIFMYFEKNGLRIVKQN